jgi:hypothetical protein
MSKDVRPAIGTLDTTFYTKIKDKQVGHMAYVKRQQALALESENLKIYNKLKTINATEQLRARSTGRNQ